MIIGTRVSCTPRRSPMAMACAPSANWNRAATTRSEVPRTTISVRKTSAGSRNNWISGAGEDQEQNDGQPTKQDGCQGHGQRTAAQTQFILAA